MLDGGCPAIGRDVEGKRAKASQSPPPKALRQRGLSRTPALKYPRKANGSYQHPTQSLTSSQIQLATTNKRKGFVMAVAVGFAPSLSVALLLCEDTLSFVDGVPDFPVVQSCCDLSVSYLSCS